MKDGQRIGVAGFVRLLALLRKQPMTAARFRVEAELAVANAYKFIRTAHMLGLLRIVGWEPGGNQGCEYPVYAYPGGADEPAPQNAAPALRSRVTRGVVALATVLRALAERSSKQDLIRESGLSHSTAEKVIAALREHKFIRIADWEPRSNAGHGEALPQYQLGDTADKPKPPPQRRRDINKRHWQRTKARRLEQRVADAFRQPQNDPNFTNQRGIAA